MPPAVVVTSAFPTGLLVNDDASNLTADPPVGSRSASEMLARCAPELLPAWNASDRGSVPLCPLLTCTAFIVPMSPVVVRLIAGLAIAVEPFVAATIVDAAVRLKDVPAD